MVAVRVLVLEDELSVRSLLERYLIRAGYHVTSAASGADVLEGTEVWDLAIVDFSLPGMSGDEVIRRLRHRLPALPAILTSGSPLRDPSEPGMRFLQKPFAPARLLDTARELLGSVQC